MIDIQGNCLEVGTPVIYATDKTYKYPNVRFYVKELNYVDGKLESVVVGRKKDNLANVSMSPDVATLSLLKVDVPQNKAMDEMDFIETYGTKSTRDNKRASVIREQITKRILDMVKNEPLTKRGSRYRVIGEQLHVMVNNGLNCPCERIPAIDLLTFDYDQLNDYQLPVLFELIVARHYTQR